MFKNKTFLIGMGIGLILGAVLLQLMNSIPDPSDNQLITNATLNDSIQLGKNNSNDEKNNSDEPDKVVEPEVIEKPIWAFTIANGTKIDQIAKMLDEMQLISDEKSFFLKLQEASKQGYIFEGYYIFEKLPSEEQILARITKSES